MRLIFTIAIFVFGLVSPASPLALIPVQDGGRQKPFDTFARETLTLVHGKARFKEKAAVDVLMLWVITPEIWLDVPFVEINNRALQEDLRLEPQKKHYTPKEVFENESLALLLQELNSYRAANKNLNSYFQAVERLESQYFVFREMAAGRMLRVWPRERAEPGKATPPWLSLSELGPDQQERFLPITQAFMERYKSLASGDAAAAEAAGLELARAVKDFVSFMRSEYDEQTYLSEFMTNVEIHLNAFHPFRWAWVAYLLASLFLLWGMRPKSSLWIKPSALVLMATGFGLHTYGFILRSIISGRPPVSNMYETVLWVPFGTVLFIAVLSFRIWSPRALIAANLVAVGCLILSDLSPVVLNPSIQPLEAVLVSNFWLTTHVLIITISYSAFLLAFGVGLGGLHYFWKSNLGRFDKEVLELNEIIYRSIQIGVVLLAAGIILGGIWAADSWGRFWGWDPKETWALISLLGYLAILHGRMAGWVRPFEMMALSVLAFSLVVMAWYGVNFVLGKGLHSYGFGTGGVEVVSAVIGAVVTYVLIVWFQYRQSLKSKLTS